MATLNVAMAIEGARNAGVTFVKHVADEMLAISNDAGADAGLAELIIRRTLSISVVREANAIHFLCLLAGATQEEADSVSMAFTEGVAFADANSPEGRA